MKAISTLLFGVLFAWSAAAQINLNVSFVGQVNYSQSLSDVWGYAAPDGTEYALVGTQTGVSIVSLADPANPTELFFVPGANSGWRDIKTWSTFAYVTNETGNGLAVIDLSMLPDSVAAFDWKPNIQGLGTLSSCHNIFIDEFGYAYLAGCNLNGGGLLFVDLSDPANPQYAGRGPAVYSHDVYVRDNLAFSAEIGVGVFSVIDVSDKGDPQVLASQQTPFGATHNTWLNDDGTVLFTTDETGNAPVAAYDVSNLNDIRELDQFRPLATLGTGVIPHNVHVLNDWLIVSYYTDGCIIVDGTRPENLVEVGNFDTFIPQSTGFNGAWGAYPYLPSGLILVSDIGNGLYVLQPNYVRACYLEGTVTDADNGGALPGARVELVGAPGFEESALDGTYKTGIATAGTYTVRVSKPGYLPFEGTAELQNGEVTLFDVALQPLPRFNVTGRILEAGTGNPIEGAQVRISNPDIDFNTTTGNDGTFAFQDVFEADYEIAAGKWGFKTLLSGSQTLDENNNTLELELERGIEDIFSLDLGWTVGGNAFQGAFELAIPPIGVSIDVGGGMTVIVQPGEDSPHDPGNGCYVTGNSSDVQGGVLIGGTTRLTSPLFDASTMAEPYVAYETWFLNVQTSGTATGNDAIVVRLSNGDTTVVLEEIRDLSLVDAQVYASSSFPIAEFIQPTDQMRISFEIADSDFNDVSEAVIDYFRVFDNPTNATQTLDPAAYRLAVAPNPATERFQLHYELDESLRGATLRLLNVLGQTVEEHPLAGAAGSVSLGQSLEPGVYFLQLLHEGRAAASLKLVKQ